MPAQSLQSALAEIDKVPVDRREWPITKFQYDLLGALRPQDFETQLSLIEKLEPYQHAFLLKRRLPRLRGDPGQYFSAIEQENGDWGGLDCEIEDLLSRRLLESFVQENPRCLSRSPIRSVDGIGHHFEFETFAKTMLYGFVEQRCSLSDLTLLIELIKTLRFLLELEPDGLPT